MTDRHDGGIRAASRRIGGSGIAGGATLILAAVAGNTARGGVGRR